MSRSWHVTIGEMPAVLFVSGELAQTTAPAFFAALSEYAAQQPERTVIDLSGISHIDMAGLRALLTPPDGVPLPLIVRDPSPLVQEYLQLRAPDVFRIETSTDR